MNIENEKTEKELFEVSEEYRQKCDKLKNNLDGLQVNVALSMKDDGTLAYKLENCPSQYKGALSSLTKECLLFGQKYIVAGLIPTYVQTTKERDDEVEKIVEYINTNKIVYLSVLLKKGFNAFVEAIILQYQKNRMIYNLSHLRFDGEDYYLKNEKWDYDRGGFVDEKDKINWLDSNMFCDLLGSKK